MLLVTLSNKARKGLNEKFIFKIVEILSKTDQYKGKFLSLYDHITMTARFDPAESLARMNQRSREIFKHIVEMYLSTGEPVGSRNLVRNLSISLSPATVRNVMSDLEHLGLIHAPHTSAGRLPTEMGLRLFVDGLLKIGDLASDDRQDIEAKIAASGDQRSMDAVLQDASQALSGLSHGAGMVLTGKSDLKLKHIEFVRLEPTKALVVLVGEGGSVENRVITLPLGLPSNALTEATNYLNAHIRGQTLTEVGQDLKNSLTQSQAELDQLTKKVVETGLATWAGAAKDRPQSLIIHGRGNLLEDLKAAEDLERIRNLFDDLESKEELIQLLALSEEGDGVRIFIGSENKLFSLSGSSIIVSPYRDSEQRIIGVLGVIGPTRLNYARIIPMVDYTAHVVTRLLSS